ncbi:type IV pilus biogenesis/stability protein PilW [Leucothrix pacifica]|uniref:Type IV pilus biogenesis/stability protein PilW n=1 Tax=Leucothrix pacifica TaxID=1247513 RepID=A0A317CLQ1_9GAMM|nr:type IV pilus biogenesis/stability protein PilW [Leucothrix pacifica]PWQ99141.1 type IV pilus biogenesis/stability protein PilW [Leucothrix pacifica]
MYNSIIIIKKIILLAPLLISLSACSGNPSKASPKDTKAADYNARLGAEYTRKGRLNLANEKLQKALEQNPRSADAHHYYALLQQKLGETSTADTHFRKALKLDPKNPQLLNNYGSHLCKNGYYTEASKQFMAALNDPLYTTPEFAYTNAGICIKKSGNVVQAEEYFRRALVSKPAFGSALYQMSKIKYEQGDYARAQAFLQRYHEKNRQDTETTSLCVKINNGLGDTNAAAQCSNRLAGSYSGT